MLPEYEKQDFKQLESQSSFVKVDTHNGAETYIRKSTAVWLFQEVERVSSDRLFQVRAKQPTETQPKR